MYFLHKSFYFCVVWLTTWTCCWSKDCQNEIAIAYTVSVTGPNAAQIQSNLQNGLKSDVMAKDNRAVFTFDDAYTILRVEFDTQKANRVDLTFNGQGGSSQTSVNPPHPKTFGFKKNTVKPTEKDVTSVEFDFYAATGEWQLRNVNFYVCAYQPPIITVTPTGDQPPITAEQTTEQPPPTPTYAPTTPIPIGGVECICRVRGDPVLETCYGDIRFLSGQSRYTLAVSTKPSCAFNVKIDTASVASKQGTSNIPVTMIINAYNYKLEIDRDHQLKVNGLPVSIPWNAPNLRCVLRNKFLVCIVGPCQAKFGFLGEGSMSEGTLVIPGRAISGLSGKCA